MPAHKTRKGTESQKNVYNRICSGRLAELVARVKEGVLHAHIMEEMQAKPSIYLADLSESLYKNKEGNTSLYINFIDVNDFSYAHFTMHLSEAIFKQGLPGPIHLKLTPTLNKSMDSYIKIIITNSTYKMIYNIEINNKGTLDAKTIKELTHHPEYENTLKVLNRYFSNDPNEDYSLTKKISSKPPGCFNKNVKNIITKRAPTKIPVPIPRTNRTYKSKPRKSNSYTIVKKKSRYNAFNNNNDDNIINLQRNNFNKILTLNNIPEIRNNPINFNTINHQPEYIRKNKNHQFPLYNFHKKYLPI